MADTGLTTSNLDATPAQPETWSEQDFWAFKWPLLRISPFPVSLDMLSHFEAAGLNINSVKIAQEISSRLAITYAALHRIQSHFLARIGSTTPWLQAFVIISMTRTGNELAFLGLLTCIQSYYSLESTIDCFVELARVTQVPSDLLMSRQAWQDLITNLSSHLPPPPPDFTDLLEAYNAINPFLNSGSPTSNNPARELTHTSAIGVVDFLWACGHLVPLKAPGDPVLSMLGLDAGWAAATAEWFFGLNVQLRDTFNGPYLLADRDDAQCQMVLHFGQPGIPVDTGVPIPSVALELK